MNTWTFLSLKNKVLFTKFFSCSCWSARSREDYLFLNAVFIFEINPFWHTHSLTQPPALLWGAHTHKHASMLLKLQTTHFSLAPVEKASLQLSQGYCGHNAAVLGRGLRVNIWGWMRQSAAFTYCRGKRDWLGIISWVTTSAEIRLGAVRNIKVCIGVCVWIWKACTAGDNVCNESKKLNHQLQ